MTDVAEPTTSNRGARMRRLLARRAGIDEDSALLDRFVRVSDFGSGVRASEYHVTNACNIRCKGCWFLSLR